VHLAALARIRENPHGLNRGVPKIELDGLQTDAAEIELVDDGKQHSVRIVLDVRSDES
jgi:hypothetical protein